MSIQVTFSCCISGQEWHGSHLPIPFFDHGHRVGHPAFQRIQGINSVEEDEQSEPHLPSVVRRLCCSQGCKWPQGGPCGHRSPVLASFTQTPITVAHAAALISLLSLENPDAQVSASLGHPKPPAPSAATSLDALSGACGIHCYSQNARASSHPIQSPKLSFWTWGMEDDWGVLFLCFLQNISACLSFPASVSPGIIPLPFPSLSISIYISPCLSSSLLFSLPTSSPGTSIFSMTLYREFWKQNPGRKASRRQLLQRQEGPRPANCLKRGWKLGKTQKLILIYGDKHIN